MNRNDLTHMLDQRAHDIVDTDPGARVAAVRNRVRRAQQRRNGGAVLATVAAVVATIGIVNLPRDEAITPAMRPGELVGRDVPTTTTTLGGTYRYVKGFVGEKGAVTVTVPDPSANYVLRVASEDDTDSVLVHPADSEDSEAHTHTLPGGEFGYSITVPRGADKWRVSSQEQRPVAAALYEYDAPPPGYTQGGITFPQTTARGELIKAVIGDPGQSELTGSVEVNDIRVRAQIFCRGVQEPNKYRVVLSFDDAEAFQIGACGDDDSPVITGDWVTAHVGRVREATLRVVDARGTLATVPDSVRIGFALYRAPDLVSDTGLDETIEYDGHLWSLSESSRSTTPVRGSKGQINVLPREVDTAREPVLVSWATTTPSGTAEDAGARIFLTVDGERSTAIAAGGIATTMVSTGQVARVAVDVPAHAKLTSVSMGIYRLVE